MPLDKYAPMGHNTKMGTVIETHTYTRRAKKLLSIEEQDQIIDVIAGNPLAGDIIPGTGGIRKVRFGRDGKGKSGGVRVIYYFYNRDVPIFLIDIYGKNEKSDLSKAECNALGAFAAETKRGIGK